jgi:hypothetical protein
LAIGTARGRVLIRSVFGVSTIQRLSSWDPGPEHTTYSVYGSRQTWSEGLDVKSTAANRRHDCTSADMAQLSSPRCGRRRESHLLFVALRLYTRIRINRTVGWDDYLISLASVSGVEIEHSIRAILTAKQAMLIPYSAACHSSSTARVWEALHRTKSLDEFMQATRYIVIGQTSFLPIELTTGAILHPSSFSLVGIAASKASVAAFLLRITIHQWHKWSLYILIFIVTGILFCLRAL